MKNLYLYTAQDLLDVVTNPALSMALDRELDPDIAGIVDQKVYDIIEETGADPEDEIWDDVLQALLDVLVCGIRLGERGSKKILFLG
jgi:hypothetical protein